MATYKAHTTPTKDFFVSMITKDISLEDCILDLIDNCLDGARKVSHARGDSSRVDDYSGFQAKIAFNNQSFSIEDNCGGIKISEARDYAFHFGRRSDGSSLDEYSIGLYGIGMKRAIFKIGNIIDIYSSTDKEAFRTNINVQEWLKKKTSSLSQSALISDDWDFDLDDAKCTSATCTKIEVKELHPGVSAQFSDSTFSNGLARIIGRDYAKFLQKGFQIYINDTKVSAFQFSVRVSDEFKPIHLQYTDESGVEVDLIAGMAGLPPDDLQPADRRAETDYFGWFVLCNDRIIIAADKSDETVWGDGGFPTWHYQYNGFVGVASFHAKDPALLPWKTTKRDVDSSNQVYRRAIAKMKEATRPWVTYTNARRADIDAAKKSEALAVATPLFDVQLSAKLEVPQVSAIDAVPRISYGSVQYSKPNSEIVKVKKLLGNASMPNYRMGEKTFEYFLKNESEG